MTARNVIVVTGLTQPVAGLRTGRDCSARQVFTLLKPCIPVNAAMDRVSGSLT